MAVGLRGFLGRIAIFLGLIFGYVLSWLLRRHRPSARSHRDRVTGTTVEQCRLDRLPDAHGGRPGRQPGRRSATGRGRLAPADFSITFAILLALPAVIALIAENIGHVKAVAEMTGADLDPVMGRAIAADGVGTVITVAVGGSPTTTYAENIGVMAATRVYSTAAYFVAAGVAILLGSSRSSAPSSPPPPAVCSRASPRALRDDRPARRQDLGREPRELRRPGQPGPVAAGLTLAIGFGTSGFFEITDDFSLGGIALGTIVIIAGYHIARAIEPQELAHAKMAVDETGDPSE